MVVVLLIAGIGFLAAGVLTIGFGIPVKEFSFGNTLILTGTVAACTGMIMLGLWMVVRELRNIARRLGPAVATEDQGLLFSPDQPGAENANNAEPSAPSAPPWHEDAGSRDRVQGDVPSAPEPVEAASAAKQRRNLLFSSSLRRERERAQARTADPSAPDARPPPAAPGSDSTEGPRPTFDDAWPRSERSRTTDALPRRSGRAPSTLSEASSEAAGAERQTPAARKEEPPPVTVLKSGVVDGMAYSLYSDGSIEAQMPEGMMRFASIDELRAHLDQRPRAHL
jgi:hypothetical protein